MNLDHSHWGPHSLREEEEEMVPWHDLCQEKIDGTWKRARRGFGGRKEKCCHNLKILKNRRNNTKEGIDWLKRHSVPPNLP